MRVRLAKRLVDVLDVRDLAPVERLQDVGGDRLADHGLVSKGTVVQLRVRLDLSDDGAG